MTNPMLFVCFLYHCSLSNDSFYRLLFCHVVVLRQLDLEHSSTNMYRTSPFLDLSGSAEVPGGSSASHVFH